MFFDKLKICRFLFTFVNCGLQSIRIIAYQKDFKSSTFIKQHKKIANQVLLQNNTANNQHSLI